MTGPTVLARVRQHCPSGVAYRFSHR